MSLSKFSLNRPLFYNYKFRDYYPCGACGKHCDSNESLIIECGVCEKHYHRSCTHLSKKGIIILYKIITLSFVAENVFSLFYHFRNAMKLIFLVRYTARMNILVVSVTEIVWIKRPVFNVAFAKNGTTSNARVYL